MFSKDIQSTGRPYKEIEKRAIIFKEEEGKLYHFTKRYIKVIRLGNPYPAAYQKKLKDNYWECFLPTQPFPFLFYPPKPENLKSNNYAIRLNALHKESIYKSMEAYIGAEKIELLNGFTSRFWFILCLLFRGGNYALELMQTNPAIGYLLSAYAVFHPLKSKKYWQSSTKLITKKRKDILGYFGFPACETMVKTFAKIKPESCSTNIFFILRTSLQNNPNLLRTLSYFPVHNDYSLFLVCKRLDIMQNYNLIAEIANMNQEEVLNINSQINDIYRMLEVLRENGLQDRKVILKNITDLNTYHDELVIQILKLRKIDFVPLPEGIAKDIKCHTLWIEHIHNSIELYREGMEMHHCIYSYLSDIRAKTRFVARMLYPERLTILYENTKNDGLKLKDARGKYNTTPDQNSFCLIKLWLAGVEMDIIDSYEPISQTSH